MSGPEPSNVTAWLKQHGLPTPYLPAGLGEGLRQVAAHLFSTRALDALPASPYDLSAFVNEAEDPGVADYALIAHAGHGTNSWALHYYVVRGRLAIFFQVPWGGAYTDAARAAKGMAQLFADFEPALRAAESTTAGAAPRVLVVLSGFSGPRMRTGEGTWQAGRPALPALLAALGAP
jgi:hypothetical protein